MPKERKWSRTILKKSGIKGQALVTGTTALALIIAIILTGIAVPAVMADNTTATTSATTTTTTVPTTTQTTVQTTTTTTVPTTTQTTSATTTQTTVATTVPTTTAIVYSQSSETAGFSATPISGVAPLTVEFTDTSTGSPTSWWWYFGDGATDSAQNPTHTYTDTGTFTVTLNVVIGGISYTAIENDYISVHETVATTTTATTATTATTQTTTSPTVSLVVAKFSASPITGTAPLTVTFTDTSTGSPTSWDWDFGDDGTSTLQNPSHTYYDPGKYTITLIATGSEGSDEVTRTSYITVLNPTPHATVKATAPVTSAGTDRTPAMQAAAVSQPAEADASAAQGDQAFPWFYIIAIVVIAIIAVIGVIIWRRRNWYDELG